jgi:pimeloyl-ACP methyl ester carboxylesterase
MLVAATCVAVVAVALGAAVRFLRLLQKRSLWRGPVLPNDELPDLPAGVHYTLITPEDGLMGTRQIAVYYSPPPGSPEEEEEHGRDDVVVYSHGVMHHCEDNYEIFRELHETATVVCWDYRGFGRSTGVADQTVCSYDLYVLLAWVYRTFSPRRLHLMGSSLGSNVTMTFLQKFMSRPGSWFEVKSVILCHPLYDLRDVFTHVGIPAALTAVTETMDVASVLPDFCHLAPGIGPCALVIGTSTDPVTPWSRAVEITARCNGSGSASGEASERTLVSSNDSERVRARCHDVGGSHFELNQTAWGLIRAFISEQGSKTG